MIDLAQLSDERLLIVAGLQEGDPLPLADHLASGGELYDDQREALVKYLRGELRKGKKGRPRKYAQQVKEMRIRLLVWDLQWRIAIEEGSHGSFEEAKRVYLEHDPEIGDETLKKYVPRGLSKGVLATIDEVRAEVLAKLEEANAPADGVRKGAIAYRDRP